MIIFSDDIAKISPSHLKGFFVDWKKPPTTNDHFKMLSGSSYFIVAKDSTTNKIVGYITALGDGTMTAFITQIEVLPENQNKGLGTELLTKMLNKLNKYPNIDLTCDEKMIPYYEKFGFEKSISMVIRK